MWYISFQGESDGDVNNIRVYHDSGKPHSNPDLLPTGGSNPPLKELRGFALVGNLLFVVNANKQYSQILLYEADGKGGYVPAAVPIFASAESIDSILHPFDLTFDAEGNCYVSSQDTNVVTVLRGANDAGPVASHLQDRFPPPAQFLAGTFVASSIGSLPHSPPRYPPAVPLPQGLRVSIENSSKTRIANSVRGVVFHGGYLYVADEVAGAVKAYDIESGALFGLIEGSNLKAPVHLLENDDILYIGSTGTNSVVRFDLSNGAPMGTVAPTTFIDGDVEHVSGLAFDGDGDFYAAQRKAKKITKFSSKGKIDGDFICGLPDEPEFILYVPDEALLTR